MPAGDLDDAMRTIASSIGTDSVYFAPPEERHFDPISIVIGLGGILVGAYCKGFVDQASTYAEDAGRATAAWLRARVDELFHEPDDTAEATARDVAREQVERAQPVAEALDGETRARRAAEVGAWLEVMIIDFGVPARSAASIAGSVAAEATALIGAGSSRA